ncbi:MAG: hypothetical protein ACKOEC_09975, partial [Acidimicrobiia bacterium]
MSVRGVTWSLCLLALSGIVQAGEPKPATPAPVRMWHVGNSWSCPFPFEKVGLVRPFVLATHNFG